MEVNVPEIRLKGFTEPWEQCELGDVAEFKNGMNFAKEAMGHGFPFVNLQNVFGRTIVDTDSLGLAESNEQQRRDYDLRKGDVLFIRSSVKPEGIGEAAIIPFNLTDTTYSGFIIRCRMIDGFADKFKQYVFGTNSFRNQILNRATTSANTNINQDSLSKMVIRFPSEEEQTQIGEFFHALDKNITLHKQKLDGLRKLKKGYLQKMFPQAGETVPRVRFDGFTEPWEQRKLGDISVIVVGGDIDKSKLLTTGRYPVIANALTNDGVVGYYENDYKIEAPAVTVTGRGDVGFAQARKLNFTPVVRLLTVKSDFDTDFLANAINQLDVFVESTGVPQLTSPQLANYEIIYPNNEEQTAIGNFFRNLDSKITTQSQKVEQLKQLKAAYLQKMFI